MNASVKAPGNASASNLIEKYNVPGPRYTSYPTVPYWETTPTIEAWIAALRAEWQKSAARGGGVSLYVHIPFCESLCTYCGCNTRITRNRSVGAPYIKTVLREWDLYRKELGNVAISEIHLGGGTPTFLTVAELRELVLGILEGHRILPKKEFSIEVDPRVTGTEQLEALAELGFRRVSLGVQDFDPRVQQAVHRVQSYEQVRTIVESARRLGFTSVNFDLIYGLPFQTLESVEQTMAQVADLSPDRIAFYSYAHVPWIKASQRRWTEADLPPPDLKRRLYERGREILDANGFQEIGMDHFAKETDTLWKAVQNGELHRNFMGYVAVHGSPQIGLGVSSISDAWTTFVQNEKTLETYARTIDAGKLAIFRGHTLTEEDLVLRRHILDLMTRFETSWPKDRTTPAFLTDLETRLLEPSRDGLVELIRGAETTGLKVTPAGRPFIRNVCMAFDAPLFRKAPQTRIFSSTV